MPGASIASAVGPSWVVTPPQAVEGIPDVLVPRTRRADSRGHRPGGSRLAGWLLIALVGAGVPLVTAWTYGALDIPRSDDWSYLVTLFRWVDDGRLGFNHWAAMPLIGQLVIAVPTVQVFGNSIAAVHVLSAMVGAVGLVAVAIAGGTVIPRRAAVLVALTVASSPIWMALAPTYMTDHWAFAAEMLTLACGLEFFRRDHASIGWLVASVAFGFVGVTIRQYAAVVVVAVLVAAFVDAWVRSDRRRLPRCSSSPWSSLLPRPSSSRGGRSDPESRTSRRSDPA